MVKSNANIMAVAMLVGLVFVGLPCLEALSPLAAPVMSPGAPMAMAPATDCITALTNVSDCLAFVSIGSNMTVPDKKCCPEFAGLLETNPICLCQLVGQAESFGVDIARALMLPDACKVEIPPLDACPASPASAPTPMAAGDAPGSAAATPISDGGAALSPTASGNGSGNGASSTAVHDLSAVICSAVAIFIAYYF